MTNKKKQWQIMIRNDNKQLKMIINSDKNKKQWQIMIRHDNKQWIIIINSDRKEGNNDKEWSEMIINNEK